MDTVHSGYSMQWTKSTHHCVILTQPDVCQFHGIFRKIQQKYIVGYPVLSSAPSCGNPGSATALYLYQLLIMSLGHQQIFLHLYHFKKSSVSIYVELKSVLQTI